MSSCCLSAKKNTRKSTIRLIKQRCPCCNQKSSAVLFSTLIKHLKNAWLWEKDPLKQPDYYYCNTVHCKVIYFSVQGNIIEQADIRTSIGVKDPSGDSLICYCFGVTKNDAIQNPKIKDFVVAKTQQKICACEDFNPSGKCCLKDFLSI